MGNDQPLLLGDELFERFLKFSDGLYDATGQTHQIALERLFDGLYRGRLIEVLEVAEPAAREALAADYQTSGAKGRPAFLRVGPAPQAGRGPIKPAKTAARQARHRPTDA